MSRVDYLTIGIVGICLLALGFLVYKTVRLMGDGATNEEVAVDPAYQTDTSLTPDTYSYEYDDNAAGAKTSADEDLDDEQMNYSENSGVANPKSDDKSKTANASSSGQKTSTPSTAKERDVASTPAEDDVEVKKPAAKSSTAKPKSDPAPETSDASAGPYLVIAGTFSERANADAMVKKLKKMGYDKAVVRPLGKYAVARVDRFATEADAKALEKELEDKGIEDAYVRKMQ